MADYELLLIEDNSSDAELACITFDELNLTSRTLIINNGEDAFKYLKEVENQIKRSENTVLKLVFLDIMLPKLNGFEVLERLDTAVITEQVPIVIFSSSGIEKDIVRAYDLGVNGYLIKPIDFFQHQYVLKSAINFWTN